MKVIRSFDDVSRALQAIELELFKIKTRDVDMSNRRVVNTSASRKGEDYVNRRELLQFLAAARGAQAGAGDGGGGGIECCTFGIGINTDLAVGEDITPHHIVTFNATIGGIYLNCKQPPIGAAIKGRIVKNYGTEDTIIAEFEYDGTHEVIKLETILVASLAELDFLTVHIDQIGSEFGGSGLVIKLKYTPS